MGDQEEIRGPIYDQLRQSALEAVVRYALSDDGKDFKNKAKVTNAFQHEYEALSVEVRDKHGLVPLTPLEMAFAMGWADFGFGPGEAELPDPLLDTALQSVLTRAPGA